MPGQDDVDRVLEAFRTAEGPLFRRDLFDIIPRHFVEEVARQSDVLVLLTDHRAFREVPRRLLAEKVVVDTRGVWR